MRDNTPVAIPADLDAERAALGSCMIDPDMLPVVRKLVQPADFFRESNGWMWAAMCKLYDQQLPIDTHMLADELKSAGHPIPLTELFALIENTPTALYADHYAGIVQKQARRRRQIALAQKLAEQAYDDKADPNQTDSWLKQELLNAAPPPKSLMTWEDSFDLHAQLRNEYQKPEHKAALDRWAFPWRSWNNLIDPPEPGLLITLAAADSVGKTTVAECVSEYWSRKGNAVIYVHFELNRRVMLDRRLSRNASVPRRDIITNNLTPPQRHAIEQAERYMMQWPGRIEYLHTPGWTMENVINEVHITTKKLRSDGFDDIAVIVDYVDKAAPSPRQVKLYGTNDVARDANNTTQLKDFGEGEGVRTVMLSQFRKEGKDIKFEALTREQIRGGGQKTEFANVVVLLHKDRGEDGQYTPALGVVVDKNTLGKTGRFWQRTTDCFNVFDIDTGNRAQ